MAAIAAHGRAGDDWREAAAAAVVRAIMGREDGSTATRALRPPR